VRKLVDENEPPCVHIQLFFNVKTAMRKKILEECLGLIRKRADDGYLHLEKGMLIDKR
jgi:hypothetical protein